MEAGMKAVGREFGADKFHDFDHFCILGEGFHHGSDGKNLPVIQET